MNSEKNRPLLIVEDDPALQIQLRWLFDQYETLTAGDRESALAQIHRHEPAVVTMDLGLPPDADSVSEGFRLLEQIISVAPDTKVIVLTGQNDQANALRAIALGAYDFFAKPFEPELLSLTIDRAFRLHELQQENRRLQALQHQRTAESAATRFNLDLELTLPNPMPSLSPDVEQALYRVVQETLENLTTHSRAKKFSVQLTHSEHVTLIIQDDGIGFDPSKETSGHFGLVGMRERAELVGGTLKIESEKGKGTRVVL